MRLARHVAHTVDVDGMLDSMTPEQFDEWCAMDLVEPIGHEPDRHLMAFIATCVANFMGGEVKIDDLIPWWERPKEEPATPQQQMQILSAAGVRTDGSNR